MTGSSHQQDPRAHTIQGTQVAWETARELFSLDPAVTYLNHGSFGAVPIPVQRAQQRLRDEMEANPMAFFTRGIVERLAHTRRHIAAFLGADPDGTALIPNATAGAQLALNAVDLHPGDEVLLTDHGYGAVRFAVDRLCARTGATVSEVAVPLRATDDEIVESLATAVRPGRTRFALVDHITSPTAKLFPIARIIAALHERGVAVAVDGAHAPGMLPVEVAALGADFWFGNLHKWAFAPRPTAVLVVAPEYRSRVDPLVVSWENDAGFPAAVEYGGTLDYTAWLAAPTGIHLLRTLDPARLRRNNADLAAYGQRTIAGTLGVARADLLGSDAVSMRIIPLPPGVAEDLAGVLTLRSRIAADFSIEVAVSVWHNRGYLRVSGQIYNRPEDYDQLAAALPGLLRDVARPGGPA
jgi:isopenicillin-N epimerase